MNDDERTLLDGLEEQEFNCDIQNELALYRGTGDARYVWRAIAQFQEAERPLPTEFMAKLADWAGRVQQLSDPKKIAAALELSGSEKQHVGPKHSRAYERRWRLASEVQTVRRLRPKLTLAESIAIVARNRGLNHAKVKKDYHAIFTAPLRKPRALNGEDLSKVIDRWR